MVLQFLKNWLHWLIVLLKQFIASNETLATQTRLPRYGLGFSGGLLVAAGLWLLAVEPFLLWALALAAGLIGFGLFNLVSSLRDNLVLTRINQLSLVGHLAAVIAFYMVLSRVLLVGYDTDTIVGTYFGVLKVVQLQSPYGLSIKPLLDQLGFSPSFYTPGVNGSFDFSVAYPSLSFLSLLPFYLAGLHDLRDTIFLFQIASVLLIFGLAPARLKSISLAPFGLFPFVIAYSWTDSVWAFFLVLTAFLWHRRPKASWITLGLAFAVKQLALVVAPFLLIRLWNETPESRLRTLAVGIGLTAAAFLVPNLPFIIASPTAWWSDIVAPYLPNAPSQVPAGIGLSAILLDVGVALPSSFFLVLMLGASCFMLYAYARHYRGLNSLVFAFPIVVFFLYYRSFPNYMVYWTLPLVVDFCQLGGPDIKLFIAMLIGRISWRPSLNTSYRPFRQRLTPSLLVLMVLTTAFVGVSGAYITQVATPKVQIQVNSAADPDSIGAATRINVTLKNMLTTPVSPNFFVKYWPLPYYWPNNDTRVLGAGSQRSYLINAPDAYSAVPAGDIFHVFVYDNLTNQLLGESAASKANIPIPKVANPGLKWWALDPSVARKVPFGWRLSMVNIDSQSSGISPLGVDGTSRVTFTLNYTSTSGLLEQLTLSQKILFNSTRVQLGLNQTFNTNLTAKSMVLAGITDGTHAVYYIFSNKITQQTINQYSTNATVIVPIAASSWTTVTLNPQSLWNTPSWGLPQQVTLAITVQSTSPGLFYAGLDEIVPV